MKRGITEMPNGNFRFSDIWEGEGDRLFLFAPILIGLGVGLYFSLQFEPDLNSLLIILPLAVLCIGIRLTSYRALNFLFVPVLLILAGFGASQFRQSLVAAPILTEKAFGVYEGQIIDLSKAQTETRMTLANVMVEGQQYNKIRLNVRTGSEHLSPHMLIRVKAVLLPPPSPTHPGAYDFQRDLYFKSIGAVGYAVTKPEIIDVVENEGMTSFISNQSIQLRHKISKNILENAPEKSQGFLLAIMIGEKRYLSKDVEEDMRKSGLAHMLAISGLHMVMIGGLVFFAVRFVLSRSELLALNYPIKIWAAVAAIICVTGYLFVSGTAVSAIRAYIMILLVLSAVCFNRTAISLRNVAFAAVIILLLWPESLLGASFQMSFAAVAALVFFYEKFGTKFVIASSKSHFMLKPFIYVWGVALTSLIATFATSLFAIYHFGQFSLAGIFVNPMAVPIMGFFVMPLVVLSFLLMPIGAAEYSFKLAALGIEAIEYLAAWGADYSYSSIPISAISPAALIFTVLAFLSLICFKRILKASAVLCLLTAMFIQANYHLPEIMISESGNLILFQQSTENSFINERRRERFIRSRWQEHYGVAEFSLFPDNKNTSKSISLSEIRCDPVGCVWDKGRVKIAYSFNPYSHKDDCQRSHIFIAKDPIKIDCNEPALTIDRFDLWRGGAHAIYLSEGTPMKVESVNGIRGHRPWVPIKK